MSTIGTRAQDKRLWLGGGAVVAVLIALIGWFVVINPELSAASSIRDQVSATQLQNTILETKNGRLKEQNEDAAALRAGLVAALDELPSDGGLPEFTRQLSAQAAATSVSLTSVIVGSAGPVADTPATTDSGGSADTAATEVQSNAVVQMTISVTATGLGADLQAFLREVQVTGPRRALVTTSQLSPDGDRTGSIDGPCTMTLTLDIFSAPLSPEDQAALDKLLSGN